MWQVECRADIPTLKKICRDDVEALDLLDEAAIGRQGERTDLVDIVNEVHRGRPDGNSSTTALRTLRKRAPAIHQRVIAGELSPHTA